MSDQEKSHPIELEPSVDRGPIESGIDRRRRMEEPLPVRLIAINHVELDAPASVSDELDNFYLEFLEFVRGSSRDGGDFDRVYDAENFQLRFRFFEDLIQRGDYRPTLIEVQSLAAAEQKLIEREWEYARQKALSVGQQSLLLQDPAGNWIELIEAKIVV